MQEISTNVCPLELKKTFVPLLSLILNTYQRSRSRVTLFVFKTQYFSLNILIYKSINYSIKDL